MKLDALKQRLENSRDLPDLLNTFAELREHRDELREYEKAVNAVYDKYSSEIIPERFDETGTTSHTSRDKRFTVSTRTYASIVKDAKAKAYDWLRNNGYGSIIKPTVNASELSSLVKSMLTEEGVQPPNELVNVHLKRGISVTTVKQKSGD